jgi:hypothetical protein
MESNEKFTAITAIHVTRGDGVHVEFVNSHQVEYRAPGLTLRLEAETFIGPDGAPDGSVVEIPRNLTTLEGAAVGDTQLKQIISDMHLASVALRSKFYFE